VSVEVRPLDGDDEFRAFLECDAISFGVALREAEVPLARAFVEPDRAMGAFEGGRLVGACANLSMEVTVPGPATVPCAGVTYVSVLPSHRRRGILTAMMGRLLDDAEQRGEPMAVLIASEGSIYGRFGFGAATQAATYELEKAHARFRDTQRADGALRVVGKEEAATILPAVHAANRAAVPGNCSRSEGWWGWHLRDAEEDRDGASPMYHVVHEPTGGGPPDGYVSWRVEQRWAPNADSVAIVVDHSASGPGVRLALLELVCHLDLVSTTRLRAFPVDDPLRWALVDPRRLLTASVHDMLWLRPLDVPRCLAARSYRVEDRVVLEVEDVFRPARGGRFALDTRDGVTCEPTGEPADLAIAAAVLGALYLGGVAAAVLADAVRLRPLRDGAVGRATRLFATDRAPYGDTDF